MLGISFVNRMKKIEEIVNWDIVTIYVMKNSNGNKRLYLNTNLVSRFFKFLFDNRTAPSYYQKETKKPWGRG